MVDYCKYTDNELDSGCQEQYCDIIFDPDADTKEKDDACYEIACSGGGFCFDVESEAADHQKYKCFLTFYYEDVDWLWLAGVARKNEKYVLYDINEGGENDIPLPAMAAAKAEDIVDSLLDNILNNIKYLEEWDSAPFAPKLIFDDYEDIREQLISDIKEERDVGYKVHIF